VDNKVVKTNKRESTCTLINKHGKFLSSTRFMHNLPAPKIVLPGNELSYNPPLEYLLTESEEKKLKEDALEELKIFVAPKKFNSLRLVPSYDDFIKEQFNRCLDMYLCPRQMKMRVSSIYSNYLINFLS